MQKIIKKNNNNYYYYYYYYLEFRGLAAGCPISRIITSSRTDAPYPFQDMVGILSSKGFPEQFDDLCPPKAV
jgi:hypothetical protein